jgi:hypothetical protein
MNAHIQIHTHRSDAVVSVISFTSFVHIHLHRLNVHAVLWGFADVLIASHPGLSCAPSLRKYMYMYVCVCMYVCNTFFMYTGFSNKHKTYSACNPDACAHRVCVISLLCMLGFFSKAQAYSACVCVWVCTYTHLPCIFCGNQ